MPKDKEMTAFELAETVIAHAKSGSTEVTLANEVIGLTYDNQGMKGLLCKIASGRYDLEGCKALVNVYLT